jgi:hypothetical protein
MAWMNKPTPVSNERLMTNSPNSFSISRVPCFEWEQMKKAEPAAKMLAKKNNPSID